MTEPAPKPSQGQSSLQERVEIMAKELELAIHWQRPCILFAVYSSEYVRADVETMLENCLIDLGQETIHIGARAGQSPNLFQVMGEHEAHDNLVFFVGDLSRNHPDDTSLFISLNARREFFIEGRFRIVFWLTQKEIADLAHRAPDFWSFRHCVVEFIEAPKMEQVLVQELEAAWQGTGEYADQFEDTDEKISLRESLLVSIPQHDETASIRANLLLTLGILNWRKGDFEKADELLAKALKIATQIQDNWFEAECYNASALLWSSMGKNEDAIEAYKQAIRLAPEQIFAWNNLGNLCAKIGRNDEALVTFLKAIEYNPQDPIAWNGLGDVYQKIGYVDDAITAYRKSIQFTPSFAPPWNGLGDAYASVGRGDDAIKAYQQAAQLNQRYVTPWLRLGNLFSKQERYRDALKAFQHAAMLDPRNSSIWNEMGLVYSRCNALEDAIAAFSKAIEIDRGYGSAYRNLGLVYTKQGKYTASVPLFLRSVELLQEEKDKAVSWECLGNVYRQLNEYEKAVEAYEMADKLERGSLTPFGEKPREDVASFVTPQPMEPMADVQVVEETDGKLTVLESETVLNVGTDISPQAAPPTIEKGNEAAPGWIFGSNCELADSEQSENEIVFPSVETPDETDKVVPSMPVNPQQPEAIQNAEESSTDAMFWNEKGNEYFKRGAFEDAIIAYNKAIQLDARLGWSYSNLAHIYVMQNQYAEALLLYQKSIDLLDADKDKAVCWNGLGNVYRCLNDYANAVAAYQKAAELDPDTAGMRDGTGVGNNESASKSAQAWNDLGEAFLKSGSYKDAITAFKKAIEMDRKLGWAYSNLALAMSYQGKYAEAIPLYKTAVEMLSSNKDKSISLNRLGNAYRKLNDYDNAIKSFQEAIALTDEGKDLVTRVRFSLLSNCCAD
jgi:superkiller protein 3